MRQQREVGIDLERLRPDFAGARNCGTFLLRARARGITRIAAELRTEKILSLLTREEAYLKARGDGLQIPWTVLMSLSPRTNRGAKKHAPDMPLILLLFRRRLPLPLIMLWSTLCA